MSKKKYTATEAKQKLISVLIGSEPIRFTVEEIKEYQESADPFTQDELQSILDDELALGEDMNTDLVDYILEILN